MHVRTASVSASLLAVMVSLTAVMVLMSMDAVSQVGYSDSLVAKHSFRIDCGIFLYYILNHLGY